jgi:LuxR family quorum sensing-dependent transcriptional regulator
MESYSQLSETLARVATASTISSLWAGVKEFVGRHGYSHVAAVDMGRLPSGHREAMLYSDAPQVFEALDREIEPAEHPFIKRVRSSPAAFLVSEVRKEIGTGRWCELLADTVKTGEALYVPVYKGQEPVAGFNFAGDDPDTTEITRSMLRIVAHAATDRAFDLRQGKGGSLPLPLSARESQCLRHVATGHADVEIGQMLGISPRTVRFHVDSAKSKLGVQSRVQAVAKALRERIITV